MTYSIRLPDGSLVENIPDDVAPEAAKAKILTLRPDLGSKERTFGEAATDIGAGIVKGLGQAAQLPGQLYGLATGDFSETGTLGAGKRLAEYGESLKSAGLKAREAASERAVQEAEKKGEWAAFKKRFGETVTDPAQLLNVAAENIPQLLIPGGAAAAAGRRALAAGAAREAAIKAGTRAAVGAGAVQQGTDVGADAYEQIYKRLVAQGTSEADAAAQAINLARATGASGAIISLLTSKLPGGQALERALAGEKTGLGRVTGALTGIVKNIPEETLEETGGRFSQNVALRGIDPTQSLTQGLGTTAGQAAASAIGMGGTAGAIGGGAKPQPPTIQPPPPAAPPPVEPSPQGELFSPEDLAGLQRKAETTEGAGPLPPAAELPAGEQLGLGLEDQRRVEDLFLERERLKKEPQTPEVKARIAEVSERLRSYIENEYAAIQQDLEAQKAAEAEDAATRKRFPALAEAPIIPRGQTELFGEEELPVPEEPQRTLLGTPVQPKVEPAEPQAPKGAYQYKAPLRTVPEGKEVSRFPKPAKPVAPEPTMEAAPEAPKAGAITSQTLDDMGIQGKGVRGWFEQNVVGKTVEEVRAETEKNPALLQGKGERPQLLRELIAPKAEPFDVTQKITPPPAAQPQPQPGTSEPSIPVSGKPARARAVPPRGRRATAPGELAPPVGGGLADIGQPAVAGDGNQGAQRSALAPDAAVRARLQAILDNREAGKRSKQIALETLDMLDDESIQGKSPEDRARNLAWNIREAERQATSAEKLMKYSKAEEGTGGQTLDQLNTEVANAKGVLGAALRRLVKSGKIKLAASHPEGKNVAGEFDGSTATLYADNIAPGRALSVAMHEVAAHLGLTKLLGENAYNALAARIERLAETDPLAQRALDRVPQDIKDAGGQAYLDEVIAYYIEEMANAETAGTLPKSGPVRNLWNRVKAAIVAALNRALGTSFGVDSLTPQQIKEIANAAFTRESVTGIEQGAAPVRRESVPASISERAKQVMPKQGNITMTLQSLATTQAKKAAGLPLITRIRTKIADRFAAVEARLMDKYDGAIRDAANKVSSIIVARQAEDVSKLMQAFYDEGGLSVDPTTKLLRVTKEKEAANDIFPTIRDWANKLGVPFEQAYAEASTILEGMRVSELVKSNMAGKTDIALHWVDANGNLDQQAINDAVAAYNANPELKKLSDIMDAVRIRMVDQMEATGRLTPEDAKVWREVAHYVPFDRLTKEFDKMFSGNKRITTRGIAHLGKLPELKGSERRPVGNVFDNYFKTLGWMASQVAKQNANTQLMNDMVDAGYARDVGFNSSNSLTGITAPLYVNGEQKFYEFKSEYDAVAFLDRNSPPRAYVKFAGRAANLLRLTATANPVFAATQVATDIQSALLFSGVKNPISFAVQALYNFGSLSWHEVTNVYRALRGDAPITHEIERQMRAMGLSGEVDYTVSDPALEELIRQGVRKRTRFGSTTLGAVIHGLEQITHASDLAVRAALYSDTLKATQDADLAAVRARELINFRRRGSSTMMQDLVTMVPFFNAAAQATDIIYRSAVGTGPLNEQRAAARKVLAERLALYAGFALAYALANSGDDEYEDMDRRVRDVNWVFPNNVRIPIRGDIGAVKVAIENAVDYWRRQSTPEELDGFEAIQTVGQFIKSQYIDRMVPVPALIRPLAENIMNYSLLTGRALEGTYQQTKPVWTRESKGTSDTAKAIAQVAHDEFGVDVSPVSIDNAFRGYMGTFAATVTGVTDLMLNPDKVDRPLHKMVGIGAFAWDSTQLTNPKNEFYELREKVMPYKVELDRLSQVDMRAAEEFADKHQTELMAASVLAQTLQQLSALRKYETFLNSRNAIESGMTKEEREAELESLPAIYNEMTRYIRELKVDLRKMKDASLD